MLSPWTGSGAQPGAWGLQRAAPTPAHVPIPVPGTAAPCAVGCSLLTPAGTRCPMLWVPCQGLSGDTTSLPGSPCAGPRVLASPKGAAGSCLPSCAWLNLNRAGLLHQSLPAGDKDQQDPSGTVLGSCCGEGRGMWGSGGMRPGWARGLSSCPGPHAAGLGPDVLHRRGQQQRGGSWQSWSRTWPHQSALPGWADKRLRVVAGAVGLPCAKASGAGGSREPPHRAWGWRAPAACSHGPNPSASRPHVQTGCWERGACAPNNGRSGEAKRNFQEERAPQALAPPGATGRARSCWPQVQPQQERWRVLGPGTRGGCVPAAPAAFQEQYCWHQAGSLRRQRIHGPFMRGAGMIYCLEEGAGVGGWSPLRPAPHACSLPRGPAHERGRGSSSVQANSKYRLSLVGFGAERVPLPRLHRAHLWAPPPW